MIGVNTAILSPNGGSIGIGFAMSSRVVQGVVDQLRDFGETKRGWLGVRIQNVDEDVAEALGLEAPLGALVTDVPEGPALDAGLRAGDVIVEFDGAEIEDSNSLVRIVANTEVGKSVDLKIFRDRAEMPLSVEIGRLEEATLASVEGPGGETTTPSDTTVLGLTIAPLTNEFVEAYGIEGESEGLIVTGVEEGSDAAEKGIVEGDLIVEVGQQPVTTTREMRDRIGEAEEAGRNSILLLVRRDGGPRFVALGLEN